MLKIGTGLEFQSELTKSSCPRRLGRTVETQCQDNTNRTTQGHSGANPCSTCQAGMKLVIDLNIPISIRFGQREVMTPQFIHYKSIAMLCSSCHKKIPSTG